MALLSRKKKTSKSSDSDVVSEKAEKHTKQTVSVQVLIRPRITEKATDLAAYANAYVFDVQRGATKKSVAKAVESFYKVRPVKVAIVTIPRKQVFVRGKWGVSGGGKKAYVYLKEGDKIEFV